MKRPIIGVSCDDEARPIRQVTTRHSLLQHTYVDAIIAAGGVPVLLPNVEPDLAADVVFNLSGLVLSGGDFDIDPALFHAPPHEKLGTLKPERTRFELALLRAADAVDLPILGVCGGMQLMNVARGGTLFQDLSSERPGPFAHVQAGDRRDPGHGVALTPGGTLARLLGPEPLPVNSTHHQGVRALGEHLVTEATADDGLVEGFSDPRRRFFLGVQWHPEAMREGARHATIYAALIRSAVEHPPPR